MNKLLRWKFWKRYLVCSWVGHVWNDHKIITCHRCGCTLDSYKESIAGQSCRTCEKYIVCPLPQNKVDWCSNYTNGNWSWYWTVALMALGLVMFLWFISGCTTRMSYRHEWIDKQNEYHTVDVKYSAGVGNSDKQAVEIILGDGASLTFGKSTIEQDEFMKVLRQYGITLEKIAEAWLKAGAL